MNAVAPFCYNEQDNKGGFVRGNIIKLGFFICLLSSLFAIYTSSQSAYAASFTVTNINDSGAGSLRQAILSANSTSSSDTINFSIGSGVAVITPISPLPPIIYPINIDGTTQPGFSNSPLIVITGINAGQNSRGLYITGNAAGSVVRGLDINSFSAQGIFIDTSNVSIKGNYIGTDRTGTDALPNAGDGVAIFSGTSVASANNNTIGGTITVDRNIISGNGGNGVGITAQSGGTANNNIVQGNYIGTNSIGKSSIANRGDGVLVNHADSGGAASVLGTIIGGYSGTTPNGACTGACNLVSGNGANGIGLWHSGVSGTVIYGNYVGVNVDGTSAVPNSNIGVEVNEAPNNTVGGLTPAYRNIFSGNGGAGIFLTGAVATGNVIQGNYIGTNTNGTSAVPNKKMGLGIGASPGAVGAHSNIIGGTNGITTGGACTGACNVISGNKDNGIFITGSESYGHIIEGNFIGLSASGTYGIGNGLDGIGILNTPNIQIGGTDNSARNVISSNGGNGVIIAGGASTGNLVERNFIGLNTVGSSSGNQASGIAVSSANYNTFLENSIAYNGILGIDLDNNGSPNLNDVNDTDTGANNLQNFPVIYAAKTLNGITKIGGQLNSEPNKSFRIEFFANQNCNAGSPKDYGQGQIYLGYTNVSTDQFGNTAFGFTPSTPVTGNTYITATATLSDTSEFSRCILVNTSKPTLTYGASWFLKNGLTNGPADYLFGYGFPSYFLMCAWDNNQPGVKLPTIYSNGTWYMRASYTTGTADLSFSYGNSSYRPVCGDWNGDGVDTVGVVTPAGNWLLRNTNSSGIPDAGSFQFGPTGTPVIGDWNGDGVDTVGIVTNDRTWYLRNENSAGTADGGSFQYGSADNYAVIGDWNGDGVDTVGVVNTSGTWYIRNSNSSGAPNGQFQFGFPGATPLTW